MKWFQVKYEGVILNKSQAIVKDHSLIFHLEPLHSILLCDTVLDSNTGLAPSATSHTIARTLQNNKEVHSINTS